MTKNIFDIAPEFAAQRKLLALPRTLMGGTAAMRKAGVTYLPKKAAESQDDYNARLAGAVLVDKFAATVDYLKGQVFQKPVSYQVSGTEKPKHDVPFFEKFEDDVDLAGNSLSVFAQKLFADGVIDGVSFVLVDYHHVETRTAANGRLEYEISQGEWAPKTKEVDEALGLRPYFVEIKAAQVLDAWLDVVNGKTVLKHFRYEEVAQQAEDEEGIERKEVTRIRAFWPNKWELWEKTDEGVKSAGSGTNNMGYIPVYWFKPGADLSGVTANPPLGDLAEMNRSHWEAYADHVVLMRWMRSPVWFGCGLVGADGEDLAFGPGRLINAHNSMNGTATLTSVGIDPASVAASQDDLRRKEEYMEAYGLQVANVPSGAVAATTATQSSNAANGSDSQLKGWCGFLQDCLENALKTAAEYQDSADGPAVTVNTEFRAKADPALISLLSSQVDKGQLPLWVLLEAEKSMGIFGDEFDVTEAVEELNDLKKNEPSLKTFGAEF